MQPNDEGQKVSDQPTTPTVTAVPAPLENTDYSNHTYSVDNSVSASWQAHEFSDHQRPASWYAAYGFVSLVIIAVAFLLLRDIITVVALVMVAVIFVFGVSRKPKELEYVINEHGISIGAKHYPYDSFKCFYVSNDATGSTIGLQSMKRYLPPVSLRCPEDKEDMVLETLSHYLPYEERDGDLMESITHKFRF